MPGCARGASHWGGKILREDSSGEGLWGQLVGIREGLGSRV